MAGKAWRWRRRSAVHTASTLGKQRVKRKGDQLIKSQGPSLPPSFYQSFTSERSRNSPREDHQQGTSTRANVNSSHVNYNDCAGRWRPSSDSQAVCSPPWSTKVHSHDLSKVWETAHGKAGVSSHSSSFMGCRAAFLSACLTIFSSLVGCVVSCLANLRWSWHGSTYSDHFCNE